MATTGEAGAVPGGGGSAGDVARLAVIEFALTAGLLLLAVSTVGWLFGSPSLPGVGTHGRLLVLGVVVGGAIALAIESPPGRRSGAHLSPAITVPLWLLGLTPGRRVVAYVVAQCAGSVAGAGAAGLLSERVRGEAVSWGLIRPAEGVHSVTVFAVEAAVGGALIGAVWWVLRRHPRVRVSCVIGGIVGAQIALLGAWTGGSASPARQFGPLVLSGGGPAFAGYLLGPVVGGVIVAALAGRVRTRPASPVEHLVQGADE